MAHSTKSDESQPFCCCESKLSYVSSLEPYITYGIHCTTVQQEKHVLCRHVPQNHVTWGGGGGGGGDSGIPLLWGPWKANTQVNPERKLTQFFSLRVGAMLVVLSHTLRMEFTVQLFNRRSMYCVDMFPKIMLLLTQSPILKEYP